MANTATSSPSVETPPLPSNDSNLELSSTTAGNSYAPASAAESSEELKRLTALGALLVNMGAASEEKIFGMKDSAPMLAYRQNRMHELLVINRPQDDAAAHMFIWYKPWTWWSSGAQVSPIVKRMLTEEGSASAPRTTAPPQTSGSTQTEADVVAPPPPPDAVESKAAPSKRKKGLPPVDMRALTDEEVDALTPAVRDERAKLLRSEKHIHETLQGMEDTRYRYLVPSRDLKCEAEVMAVVRCYAERNQAKAASLAAEGGRAPSGAAAASHNGPSGGGEKATVRADLLACGLHVQRLKHTTSLHQHTCGLSLDTLSHSSIPLTQALPSTDSPPPEPSPAHRMTGSRATNNAKLVKRHQWRQSNALAKSSANKFTLRQSQFERQREEAQVREQQQADASWNTSRAVGDGLLSRNGHERGAGGYTAPEMEVRDTSNPFARGCSAPASGTFLTTTRSATMGLEKMQVHSTRTTRRIDRFNLTTSADSQAAPSPSSLMGVRRVREGEGSGVAGFAADDREEGDFSTPSAKVMRAERFREMISNSKGQRVQLQRERAERDATTVQLDAEINDLLHLLPKRNKVKEQQEAFTQSGTPEVRALLDSYRRNHQAKCLTLKSSGAFEVRTLVEVACGTTTRSAPSAQTAGSTAPESATARDAAPSFLDAADRALLARIRAGAARSSEDDVSAPASTAGACVGAPSMTRQAAADVAEARAMANSGGGGRLVSCDDFDLMMHTFQMDPRRAHAVDRTLTEEEEAARSVQQALLKEDREQVPSLHLQERDQKQLTRGEWVAQGGDIAFHMDDDAENAGANDDNVDIPSSYEGDSDAGVDDDEAAVAAESELDENEEDAAVERVGGSATLDRLFEQLEQVATSEAENATSRPQRLHALLVQLHRYAAHHVVEVTKAFRLVLVEAERSFLRGTRRGGMRRSLLVYLYAMSKIFPTSDYRHAVMTPFLLFLCSALMQMKLDSLEAVHSYLVLATLLLHCLKAGSGRFCAEVVVAALNVLALQLPRVVLEPARYQGTILPMPLLERTEQALLVSSASAATLSEGDDATSQRPPYQVGLLDTTHSPERLLLCAYRLLEEVCDLHRSTPAFPVMCARPFLALDALLLRPPSSSAVSAWTPSAAVRLAHEVLTVKVRDMTKHVEAHRTPLAMRTFRPRPLRQFDPLLAEREENALKNEVRLMKRDIREDKKRLIRHLTAEATVQRRGQEKRHAIDDALREKRYHNVMSQLQQQQHSMNVVESLKARAKSKSRKGLSGASTTSSSAEADKE